MGRRGSMKGRPGLLFILFICVCLVIFYFSWQMLMSPKFDTGDKATVIRDSESVSRIGGQKWNPRQHFNDLQQIKQPFQQNGRNQIEMPYPVADSSKTRLSSKLGQDEFAEMEKRPEVDVDLVAPGIDDDFLSRRFNRKKEGKPKSAGVISEFQLQGEKSFYFNPFITIQESVKSMDHLVHLDFKGAVPKMDYLRKVIPLFESLGATGLLVEYEDMFPFTGALEALRASNSFTQEQLSEFLLLAKKHNLRVIPLIQTFGHMEFVLKSAFQDLRESSYTPQVIDVTNNKSYAVISTIIKQVLAAHPDASYLHIGCDEVYELGKGASATVMQEEKLTVGQMFIHHVKRVAKMVTDYSSGRTFPIMWDDMLRKVPAEEIADSSLPSHIDIMVWHYTPNVTGKVGMDTFEKYGKLFKSIWIASSFKGATGSRQFYTQPLYHLKNHYSWLKVIQEHQAHLKFKGVALTGWQRYDHFATLCELLPVALPSLAVCLAAFQNAGFTKVIHDSASQILRCDGRIEMDFPEIDKKTKLAKITQDCRFPGSDVYYAMQDFYGYTQINTQHRLDGWLSDYQIAHGFSNPGQLKVLAMDLNKQNNGFRKTMGPLKQHLLPIYSTNDVEEWLEENIYERKRHNEQILDKVNNMLKINAWPRRPLPAVKVSKPGGLQQMKARTNSSHNHSVFKQMQTDTGHAAQPVVNRNRQNVNSRTFNGRQKNAVPRSDYGLINQNYKKRLSQTQSVPEHEEPNRMRAAFNGNSDKFALDEKSKHMQALYENKDVQKIGKGNVELSIDETSSKYREGESKRKQAQPLGDKFGEMNAESERILPKYRNNNVDKVQIQRAASHNQLKDRIEDRKALDLEKRRGLYRDDQSENTGDTLHIPHNSIEKEANGHYNARTRLGETIKKSDVKSERLVNLKNSLLPDFHDDKMNHYEKKIAEQYA